MWLCCCLGGCWELRLYNSLSYSKQCCIFVFLKLYWICSFPWLNIYLCDNFDQLDIFSHVQIWFKSISDYVQELESTQVHLEPEKFTHNIWFNLVLFTNISNQIFNLQKQLDWVKCRFSDINEYNDFSTIQKTSSR